MIVEWIYRYAKRETVSRATLSKGWLLHIIANSACSLPGASSLYMPKALRPLDPSQSVPRRKMDVDYNRNVDGCCDVHIQNLRPKMKCADRAWFQRSVLVGNMDCNGDQVVLG